MSEETTVKYRYASTMGERYAFPLYFETLESAQAHRRMCERLIGGLPGQDSMQIEEWRAGMWVASSPDYMLNHEPPLPSLVIGTEEKT